MVSRPLKTSLETLAQDIPSIFDQVQTSVANHRKNCVALHKLHARVSIVGEITTNGSQRLTGEHRFATMFLDMLSRVLVLKKGVQPADRVVKFVGAYAKFISDKGLPSFIAESQSHHDDEDDTPVSRFIARLLNFLLRAFEAKDKNVRFRSVSVVTELVAHLGELDEDVYSRLRNALLERTRDKEPNIRAYAVVALTKLISGEDSDDGVISIMLDCLCYDPTPEVRRLVLVNIPIAPATLPAMLTRTRDKDSVVRSLLYGSVLSKSSSKRDRKVLHPSQLSIEQRERLVRDGLGDREDRVRAVAADMLVGWFDLAGETGEEYDFLRSAINFLQLFDIVSPGGESIAADALRSIFLSKPQALRKLSFPDTYWRTLTPESVLFARCFIEHTSPDSRNASCSGIGFTAARLVEDVALPVVTAFAFFVQEACNTMFDVMEEWETLQTSEDDEDLNDEDLEHNSRLINEIFVLNEMLKIASCLDYTDEMGRRKMFMVVRSIVGHEYLPESLIESCLDVLKQSTTDEREMIRVVVEVITEQRDTLFEDEGGVVDEDVEQPSNVDGTRSTIFLSRLTNKNRPERELTVQEKRRADEIDLRCLCICIALLKRVNGRFDENSTLEGIVADLIIPAVKRCEATHREQGLVALGLCCLIAKHMALQSFPLFCNQAQNAPEDLKAKVFQIIFDLLLMHADSFFGTSKAMSEQILVFLLQTLENDDSFSVRAVICIGLSKLMLNGLIIDDRVLATLVLAFVSPVNAGNEELRQCLAYFIPAYSHSSSANQSRMQSIFLTVFDLVIQAHDELQEHESMITPAQFCLLFVDWIDPSKRASGSASSDSGDPHLDLALDVLKAIYDGDQARNHKYLVQILSKLYMPTSPDPCCLLCLKILAENMSSNELEDPSVQKVVEKFKSKIIKHYATQLAKIDATQYEMDPRYMEACELTGVRSPAMDGRRGEDEDEEEDSGSSEEERTSRKRIVSPMKPATRRKARSVSAEACDHERNIEMAPASMTPPLSKSPSPSPSSSSLPTPSLDAPTHVAQQAGVLPFKSHKKRKVIAKEQLVSSSTARGAKGPSTLTRQRPRAHVVYDSSEYESDVS